MDEVDIANELIERDMELRLAEARSKVRTEGSEVCQADDCGEPMPMLRRKMGLQYCVDCASVRERRAKLFTRD